MSSAWFAPRFPWDALADALKAQKAVKATMTQRATATVETAPVRRRSRWAPVKCFLGDCFVTWATAGRITSSGD